MSNRAHWPGWFAILLALCLPLAAPAADPQPTVIIISIDGLRPEFYLPGEHSRHCPTLVELRERGAHARAAIAVYPSLTYPGHASIATGAWPARHGVTANSVFNPPRTEGRGYWFARDLKVPALWDIAHAAGLSVAAVSWPTTAGSDAIRHNLPEFWPSAMGGELDMMRRHASPGLVEELQTAIGPMADARQAGPGDWDAFLAKSAAHILVRHKPALLLVHLIEPDKVQHQGGRDAPGLPAAMTRADTHVRLILNAARAAGLHDRATFIVVGDHGFSDVARSIAPNVLLAANGYITLDGRTVTDWQAIVQNTGGSAGVYLRDPDDAELAGKVRALLEEHATDSAGNRLYQILDKPRLQQLGAPPAASFYLEAEPGYMFSGSFSGASLVRGSNLKGNHGFLPDKPEMHTGFIAFGHGIKPGVALQRARLVDVAPTVAALLGLKLDDADGRVLHEILAVN
jgi:predicted AlkP superfamily pyrophosphatase or phosphodiesterase